MASAETNECGVGVLIDKAREGPFVITGLVEGNAAALSGQIKVNDILHAVDMTSLYELNAHQTKALMDGAPGSEVTLWIQDGSAKPHAGAVALAARTQDEMTRLRQRIAVDPKGFFAQADQDGSLSWDEWEKACTSFLGDVGTELSRALFDQMDFDKDGTVSKEEFVEMRNAIQLFVKGANCQELIVESLAGLVAAHLTKSPQTKDQDTSVADKTLVALTELSVDEMCEELALLPLYLREHGGEVKRERESRAKNMCDLQVDQGVSKFAHLPTAAYGTKDDFHKSLESIGLPHPDVLEEMQREFLESLDSLDKYKAYNNISNETTSEKEWYFVFDPFLASSVQADKAPEEWELRFEYGGDRTPIRRQVFMHVLSVNPWKSGGRFGQYKEAHELDQSDPTWLHEKEVDMVKVVLCRVISTQLDGISLTNAFQKTRALQTPKSLENATVKAKKISAALFEGLLKGGDGSACTCTFAFLAETVLRHGAATEEELEALIDHVHAKFAALPISEPEVIAARLYTGPPYVKFNSSLRETSGAFSEEMTGHLKGNRYVNAIYACNSMLRKASFVSKIPAGRVVYRGISGVKLPDKLLCLEEGGGRGGVEYGFFSTTTSREVAVSYLASKGMPVLFQIEVGDIDRGADLAFLSQYPLEREILIPPMSYLEVVGEYFQMESDKGTVKVYPARINCNLKSQTIEEINAHRQKEVLSLLPYLGNDLCRDLPAVVAALATDVEERESAVRIEKGDCVQSAKDTCETGVVEVDDGHRFSRTYKVKWREGRLSGWLKPEDIVIDESLKDNEKRLRNRREEARKKIEEKKKLLQHLRHKYLSDFDDLRADLEKPEQIDWINQDCNYKDTVCTVIDFKHACLTKLVKAVYDEFRDGDPLQEGDLVCPGCRLKRGKKERYNRHCKIAGPSLSFHSKANFSQDCTWPQVKDERRYFRRFWLQALLLMHAMRTA
jgi:hypothetical protein